MHRKIAAVDIDGTLFNGQIQLQLIKFFYEKGKIRLVYFLKLSVYFALYKAGIYKKIEEIYKVGLEYLRGQSTGEVDALINEYFETRIKSQLFPKSFNFINSLKVEGYEVVLLSTAVDSIVSKVAELFDVSGYVSTRLQTTNGFYTGLVDGDINYGLKKISNLKKYLETRGASLSEVTAYADHESDIPLLKAVSRAYVVNPDQHMKKLSRKYNLDTIDLKTR